MRNAPIQNSEEPNFIVYNYRIPYKEGAELFQRCSVVALPYIDASQSGVIPTAYGFKKPVVVTEVGAIPEIVGDGITGFIVPPRNPEALAEAIVSKIITLLPEQHGMCHLHIILHMFKSRSYTLFALTSPLFGSFFNGENYISEGVITPTWRSQDIEDKPSADNKPHKRVMDRLNLS